MENTVVLSSDDSMENSSWEWYIDPFMLQLPEAKAAAANNAGNDNPADGKPNYSIVDRSCLLKEYLGFKKRRKGIREIIQLNNDDDDSLEDTASSPIDFSKVKDLSYLTSSSEKKDVDAGSIFQMNANNVVQDSRKRAAMDEAADHQASINATEIKSGCNNALRKRGLCLVPLSMLINYLG